MSILKQNPIKNATASAAQGAVAVGAALGGGLLGAAIGRASLLAGIAAAAAGKYYDNDYITAAGLGMAAGGFADATATRVNGIEGVVSDIGELGFTNMTAAHQRVNRFLGNVRRRLYVLGDVDGMEGLDGFDDYIDDYIDDYTGIAGLDEFESVGNVDDLIDQLEDAVGELAEIAGLGDLDGQDELLNELADIAEDIVKAVEVEGQITGLDGEDEVELLDALDDLVEAIDGLSGLDDIEGLGEVEDILTDIGDLLGWEMGDIESADEPIAAALPPASDMFLADIPTADFSEAGYLEEGGIA